MRKSSLVQVWVRIVLAAEAEAEAEAEVATATIESSLISFSSFGIANTDHFVWQLTICMERKMANIWDLFDCYEQLLLLLS